MICQILIHFIFQKSFLTAKMLLLCLKLVRELVICEKKNVKDIINTLKKVHSFSYIHRDLRKYNLIRDQCENIVIIDWGFSIKLEENHDFTFAGALDCMPDSVLQSIVNEDSIVYGPEVDLICLVRSFYLMLHRPPLEDRIVFDKDNNIKSRAQLMLNFWRD